MRYDRTVIAYHGCDADVADQLLAGIFTPDGELTDSYKDNGPSPDFPILEVLRASDERGPMHHEQVMEALRQRWVVMANEVLVRMRRMAAAGFLTTTDQFHFSM